MSGLAPYPVKMSNIKNTFGGATLGLTPSNKLTDYKLGGTYLKSTDSGSAKVPSTPSAGTPIKISQFVSSSKFVQCTGSSTDTSPYINGDTWTNPNNMLIPDTSVASVVCRVSTGGADGLDSVGIHTDINNKVPPDATIDSANACASASCGGTATTKQVQCSMHNAASSINITIVTLSTTTAIAKYTAAMTTTRSTLVSSSLTGSTTVAAAGLSTQSTSCSVDSVWSEIFWWRR